jgi:hypothetical protein
MNIINQLLSPILIISLTLPVSGFAQSNANHRDQAQQANRYANQTIQELQHQGTEFYLDAAKKQPINPRDLISLKGNAIKLFAVAPYDRALNARIAFSQTLRITEDGNMKLTVEILKNESSGLKAYPIRAIKTVTIYGNNASTAKIETSRAIQAALKIAQNQMSTAAMKKSTMENLASKIMESVFPSAHAGFFSVISHLIMVVAGVIMIKFGFQFLTQENKGNYEVVQFIGGIAIMIMGFKMASAGFDGLKTEKK